jgi:hypothetical protein
MENVGVLNVMRKGNHLFTSIEDDDDVFAGLPCPLFFGSGQEP